MCNITRSHSFTCHPHTNHTCLHSTAASSLANLASLLLQYLLEQEYISDLHSDWRHMLHKDFHWNSFFKHLLSWDVLVTGATAIASASATTTITILLLWQWQLWQWQQLLQLLLTTTPTSASTVVVVVVVRLKHWLWQYD